MRAEEVPESFHVDAPAVLMLKGIPASGKTTAARTLTRARRDAVRVNRDDLREVIATRLTHGGDVADVTSKVARMIGPTPEERLAADWGQIVEDTLSEEAPGRVGVGRRERLAARLRDALVADALARGYVAVVDDTNLHPRNETRLRQLAREHDAGFASHVFDVAVQDAVDRDQKRADAVGERVIRRMYERWVQPALRPPDPGKPYCVVVDLDGTLAHVQAGPDGEPPRSPYEEGRADEDAVDPVVAWHIEAYRKAGMAVVAVSGRDEGRGRDATQRWLDHHEIEVDALHMRPEGDCRPDHIVKREILHQEILPRYNTWVVLDDRQQVVDMWRHEGLKTFAVAAGSH